MPVGDPPNRIGPFGPVAIAPPERRPGPQSAVAPATLDPHFATQPVAGVYTQVSPKMVLEEPGFSPP